MDELYALTTVFNPCGYLSRSTLYREFANRCARDGLILYTVEAVLPDQQFDVTDSRNPQHIQVRYDKPLWLKESLLNVALKRLPKEAKYVAWIDADVSFHNPHYILQTIQKLQDHDVVQMFSLTLNLDANQTVPDEELPMPGSVFNVSVGNIESQNGYAWAARRDFLQKLGGFLDFAILGSGDRLMRWSFAGEYPHQILKGLNMTTGFEEAIRQWAAPARAARLGYLPGLLYHHYHGKMQNRGYGSRWKILADHRFSPAEDLFRNDDGLVSFRGNKPGMEADIAAYFVGRREDE